MAKWAENVIEMKKKKKERCVSREGHMSGDMEVKDCEYCGCPWRVHSLCCNGPCGGKWDENVKRARRCEKNCQGFSMDEFATEVVKMRERKK